MLPPLPHRARPVQHCDLWIVDLRNLEDFAADLRLLLNSAETQHYARYTNLAAQRAFLGSRGCLRLLAAHYLHQNAAALQIITGSHGKPALADFPDFHFNISHSHERLALLFAPCECGVDIECGSRKVDYTPIMARFFKPAEIRSWQQQAEPQQAFFRGWTRKEAYLKATGEGISGLSKVQISFAPGLSNPVISSEADPQNQAEWHFHDFDLAPDYLGAVALRGTARPCETIFLL